MNRLYPLTVFTAVFSFVYFACFVFGFTPVRYYPLLKQISTRDLPLSAGPAMGWYTWIVMGFCAGVAAAVICLLVPRRLGEKISPVLSWLLPVGIIAWRLSVERHWFFS